MQEEQLAVEVACGEIRHLPWKQLRAFQGDLKTLSEPNYQLLKAHILRLKFSDSFRVWAGDGGFNWIINGHQRLTALTKMEAEGIKIPELLPCEMILAADWKEAKEKVLALTSQFGEMTGQGLFNFMTDAGFKVDEVDRFRFNDIDPAVFKATYAGGQEHSPDDGSAATVHAKLTEKFIVPPFSVLDTKQGYWQDRRRAWLALGIQSEVGRGDALLMKTGQESLNRMMGGKGMQGTSIFDPVVCELAYKWFCPPGGKVLDPFAGGSVRGIVASKTGLRYTGIDLREEQIEANKVQAGKICQELTPKYVCGDSRQLQNLCGRQKYDLVFSCPPYADLEKYSDDPADLSNMAPADFMQAYADIIEAAVDKLVDNRFCVWVISDVRTRGDGGFYRGLVAKTIGAFEDAGAFFYNDLVLLNSIGSAAIRAGRSFSASRKVARCHQNILVFCKGDVVKAVQDLGAIDIELPNDQAEDGDQVPELS